MTIRTRASSRALVLTAVIAPALVGCSALDDALDVTSASCASDDLDILLAAVEEDPALRDPYVTDTCDSDASGGGVRQVTATIALGQEESVAHLVETYGCEVAEGGEGERLVDLTGCAVGDGLAADASLSLEPDLGTTATFWLTAG
ncbi:hypothetical protein [Nocardioides zeae]|uniref:DUF4333 domain-containing protein n=1 Tax=Nocardioides zeae TaxID=1457234 RepID=A0A6P0HK84_9ACTN|nr:hypothetical protein [Nocardioides zeae]NEN78680.1 hypothetical protein [Nocardioides zeae]